MEDLCFKKQCINTCQIILSIIQNISSWSIYWTPNRYAHTWDSNKYYHYNIQIGSGINGKEKMSLHLPELLHWSLNTGWYCLLSNIPYSEGSYYSWPNCLDKGWLWWIRSKYEGQIKLSTTSVLIGYRIAGKEAIKKTVVFPF